MEGTTFYFNWEPALIEFLQTHMGTFGKYLAVFFTMFGETLPMVVVIGFLYWCYDKKKAKWIALNVITACVWNPLIKNLCYRRRPYFDHEQIKCLKAVEAEADIMDIKAQGYSFPSGHSSGAAALYGSAALKLKAGKRKGWFSFLLFLIILGVGISRFCLGVHYPTDVLAGWIMGAGVIFLVQLLRKWIPDKRLLYLLLLLISAAGFFYCTTDDYYSSYGLLIGFLAGDLFEERFVNFPDTENRKEAALRLVCGLLLFVLLNTLLKLPFPKTLLDGEGVLSHLIRTGRYAIVTFVTMGVYPIVFVWKKRGGQSADRMILPERRNE